MPYIEPNSIIKLGRVNFDSSYTNTPSWATLTEQTTWFNAQCDVTLTRDDYTYIRVDSSIKVPFNADEKHLYEYNYCMYQNSNYSTRWFYCFITGVEYINDNTTQLNLEIDLMQTWYFDYTMEANFVDRCHAKTDAVGEHTNPEPQIPFVEVYNQASQYTETFSDWWIVIQTTRTPDYWGTSQGNIPPASPAIRTFTSTFPTSGGKYTNIINGAKYFGFDFMESPSINDYPFTMFLDDINLVGGGEAVTNIFQIPKALAPNRIGEQSNWAFEQGSAPVLNREIAQPAFFAYGNNVNYYPKNNKLFSFPYSFARIDDNNGNSSDWVYENWKQNVRHTHEFKVTAGLDPESTCFVIPQNYNGVANNVSNSFTFPCTTKCSWTTSPYLNWSAQNALGNAITAGIAIASLAVPAARGAGAAVSVLGKAAPKAASGAKALGPGTAMIKGNIKYRGKGLPAGPSITPEMGAVASTVGVMKGLDLLAQYDKMSKIPEEQKGSTGGNSLLAIGALTYNIRNVIPKLEYAKIIDSFFDLYGYSMERIMTPAEYDIRSRRSWNYIKMQNCVNHVKANSGMTSADMETINEIYNSGITFWKNHDHIGDYTQDNSIG